MNVTLIKNRKTGEVLAVCATPEIAHNSITISVSRLNEQAKLEERAKLDVVEMRVLTRADHL